MIRRRHGFTLIEMLIVVSIISILTLAAAPNFLRAQIRSKVSRAKADMMTFAAGMEAYCLDHYNYPPDLGGGFVFVEFIPMLTTPVSYVPSIEIPDPFAPPPSPLPDFTSVIRWKRSLQYVAYNAAWARNSLARREVENWFPRKGYVVSSFGPDRVTNNIEDYPYYYDNPQLTNHIGVPMYIGMVYDPTNGTKSSGDFARAGGDVGPGSGMIGG